MANFPVYIGGVQTQAVQPAQLDLSPLANSFMNSAKKRAAAKSTAEPKYNLDATVGEGLEFDASIARQQAVINKQTQIYGADNLEFVNSLPEVRKAYAEIERITSAGNMNARKQNKAIVGDYREYIKEAGNLVDLESLHSGKGIQTYGHRLNNMENTGNLQKSIDKINLKHSTSDGDDAQEELKKVFSGLGSTKIGQNAKTVTSQIMDQMNGIWGIKTVKEGKDGVTTLTNNAQREAAKNGIVFNQDLLHGLEQGYLQELQMGGKLEDVIDKNRKPTDKYYDGFKGYIKQKVDAIALGKRNYERTVDNANTGVTAWKSLSDDALKQKMATDNFRAALSNYQFMVGTDLPEQNNFVKESMSAFAANFDDVLDIVNQVNPKANHQLSKNNITGYQDFLKRLSADDRRKINELAVAKGLPPIASAFDKNLGSATGYLAESSHIQTGSAAGNAAIHEMALGALNMKAGKSYNAQNTPEGFRIGNLWYNGGNLPPGTSYQLSGKYFKSMNGPQWEKGLGGKMMVRNADVVSHHQRNLALQEKKAMAKEDKERLQELYTEKQSDLVTSPDAFAGQVKMSMPIDQFKDFINQNQFGVPKEYEYSSEKLSSVTDDDMKAVADADPSIKIVKQAQPGIGFSGKDVDVYEVNGQIVSFDDMRGLTLDRQKGIQSSAGVALGLTEKATLGGKVSHKFKGGSITGSKHLKSVFPNMEIVTVGEGAEAQQFVNFDGFMNMNSLYSNEQLGMELLKSHGDTGKKEENKFLQFE